MRTETTVEPSSVHRLHASTVFLTDVRPGDTGGFVAGALLPEDHDYYGAHTSPANRRLDPMLLLEACRQAHNYLAHRFFDVDADAAFILHAFSLRLSPDASSALPPTGPGALTMTLADPSPQRAGSRVRGLAPLFDMSVDGTRIGEAGLTVGYASAAAYRSLRTRHRPLLMSDELTTDRTGAAAPALVGRVHAADVLLADLTGDRARLLVPVEHTGLFDHPLDHVPGTLLVEGARQLATALSRDPRAAVMTSMSARFHAFAELDVPVELTAHDGTVTATQAGTEVATIVVGIR